MNYVELISMLLNVLCPIWMDKVISIGSDGKYTMTRRIKGVVTRLMRMCSNKVLLIWCHPHQLDLVVKQATNDVEDGNFYKTDHAFLVYLRAQVNLINSMGGLKCPKDTTRWIAFGSSFK